MTRLELLKEFKSRVEDGVSGGVELDQGDLRYIASLLEEVIGLANEPSSELPIIDGVYENDSETETDWGWEVDE